MRIAVWHNLPSGGGKRALYAQVKGLLAKGHQVEAWRPDTADRAYLPLSELIIEHQLPLNGPRNPPLWREKIVRSITGRDRFAEAMDRHCLQCADEIEGRNFDLIFLAPCQHFLVPRLGRFLRDIPAVLYLQEPNRGLYEAIPRFPWMALPNPTKSLFSPARWRAIAHDWFRIRNLRLSAREEFESVKRYSTVLVNSYYSRESVARAYGISSIVSYLNYAEDVFQPLNLERENIVIGLGSMDKTKGVKTAIEAVSCLPEPKPTLRWVANYISPIYRTEMESLALRLGVTLEISYRIDDSQLVRMLNQAKVMIYTSHLEPFGYAPVEAGACGTPVVAVAEGGVRETVFNDENGLLCNRDPQELSAAMSRILSDVNLAQRLGKRGMEMAKEKWSQERSIQSLEINLQSALARATSPAE